MQHASRLIAVLASMALAGPALALREPDPGKPEPRMVTAPYAVGEVYAVHVPQGQTLSIVFAADEQVQTGFGATKHQLRADMVGNAVILASGEAPIAPRTFVAVTRRPDGSQRTYTFLVDTRPPDVAHLGFRFVYPDDERAKQAALWRVAAKVREEKAAIAAIQAADPATDTNKAYAIQGDKVADWNLLPSRRVSDNGSATHFHFPGNMRVPVIYEVTADGKMQVVEPVFDAATGWATVHRVAAQWQLLGDGGAVLCVFNRAHDPIGVRSATGTASPDVERVLR